MQAIERYGVVALLLLIATVVAVLVWNGDPADRTDVAAAERDHAPAALPRAADGGDAGAPNRPGHLKLKASAESRPLSRALFEEVSTEPPAGLVVSDPANREPQAWRPPGEAYRPETREPDPVPEARPRPRETVREPRREESRREDPTGRAPTPVAGGRYVIRKGDTLGEIALAQLGTSKRWKEILALNPGLDEKRLLVGTAIVLPADAGTRAATARPEKARSEAAGRPAATRPEAAETYRVARGESLWKIAEKRLGDGERWREIKALNPKIDPDRLQVGQMIVLPPGVVPSSQPVVASNAGTQKPRRVR